MQGGGGNWAISLDKHDEERGTEPREQYTECACVCLCNCECDELQVLSHHDRNPARNPARHQTCVKWRYFPNSSSRYRYPLDRTQSFSSLPFLFNKYCKITDEVTILRDVIFVFAFCVPELKLQIRLDKKSSL